MMKTKLYARTSALPAIAAALALSSTGALAQQAQPVATDIPPVSAPTATDQAAPAPVAAPASTDTGAAAAPTDQTATPVAAKAAPKARSKTIKSSTRIAQRTVTPKPTATNHITSRTVATRTIAPAKATVTPAPANAQASQSAVKPLVDVNATPAPTASAAAKPKPKHNDTLPIAGGALAFLAIGGAAVALTRRRHDEEEEWTNESPVEDERAEAGATEARHDQIVHDQETMIAPAASAFAWSDAERARDAAAPSEQRSGEDDRLPGETWVQRAYRGPTPNNPSVSLRARLKRAAFFDKRERDVAAGKAEPVDMDAGLPEAMVEEQQRELA